MCHQPMWRFGSPVAGPLTGASSGVHPPYLLVSRVPSLPTLEMSTPAWRRPDAEVGPLLIRCAYPNRHHLPFCGESASASSGRASALTRSPGSSVVSASAKRRAPFRSTVTTIVPAGRAASRMACPADSALSRTHTSNRHNVAGDLPQPHGIRSQSPSVPRDERARGEVPYYVVTRVGNTHPSLGRSAQSIEGGVERRARLHGRAVVANVVIPRRRW